ncbi:MAG: phosphotransferase [Minwuia sp.]|uniref:phosphotransferase n=1 Tax=Minwuia sp. TaxID=2493630 RepID=UPI003A8BBBD1
MNARIEQAERLITEILGRPPDSHSRPTGSSARAIRFVSGNESVIASLRPSEQRARLEAEVLTRLSEADAPVPGLVARRGAWIFQQDLGGRRLTEALWDAGADQQALMTAALQSLAAIHAAAAGSGIAGRLATLGASEAWRQGFAGMPARLGAGAGLPPPAFDMETAARLLTPRRTALVKWDARPANAMLCDDGAIRWFDWEHCGVRDPLDDAGWLLGDEFAPADGPGVNEALAALAPETSDGERHAAEQYLLCFGTLHMSVRLALILTKRAEKGGWRDWQEVLSQDKVGSTAAAFRRTANRAGDWAGRSAVLAPLSPWFHDLAAGCPDE